MFGLGVEELVLILVIVLFLFGAKKLPELSRALGESVREIRKGFSGDIDTKKPDEPATKSAKEVADK